MPTLDTGSRKHLLDLLVHPDYPAALHNLVSDAGVVVTPADNRQPKSHAEHEEWELPKFLKLYCVGWFEAGDPFDAWQLPHGGKLPTWDLISTSMIAGQKGLLLVEAKAHESELGLAGKALPPEELTKSKANHDHISLCMAAVCDEMRKWVAASINISVNSHYQLSNRIAWAWRAAQNGCVPVILLYLGFIGDKYFADYFIDEEHWQRVMVAYMNGVLPLGLPGKTIKFENGGSFVMLVRALPAST